MPVYVDKAQNHYGRMKMCHMLADSNSELHAMADKIGVRRKWFQNKNVPHYDICQQKRALAIQHGAIEVERRQLVEIIKRIKKA
jgi:hypothetical protein